MKRLLLALLFILIMAESVFAATPGTCTISSSVITVLNQQSRKTVTLSWVASVDAATVPNTTITVATYGIGGWYFYSAETNPNVGPPTDNYDIVINDADSIDLAGGLLMNRDTSNTEMVNIALGILGQYPIIRGDLTFVLTNNLINSASGTCILTFIAN